MAHPDIWDVPLFLKELELDNIIKESIAGKSGAQKTLYITYAKYIYGISRRYSIDDAQAEDYMQEGFIRIFQKLHLYKKEKGSFKSWISRVVVNNIISEKRKEKKQEIYVSDFADDKDAILTSEDDHDKIFEEEINSSELLSAIRRLPEKYKTVLNLFIFEEMPHADIAVLLNIKSSSSRARFSRAKKMLKNILSQNLTTVE